MQMLRRARPALGTLVDCAVTAAAGDDAASTLLKIAFAAIERVEAACSAHRPDSALNRLCASAARTPQPLDADLHAVLACALDLYRASQGIFDVTIGATLAARGLLPVRAGDAGAAAEASSADLVFEADGRLRFLRPLRLDLGGIAKGYAIDQAVAAMRAAGALAGCVNAGGDLRVFGAHTEPVSLRFADGLRTVAQLHEGAFAASRPAQPDEADRWASRAGAHVDGRNHRAVASGDTVAVFAPSAMLADALTKVALVSPPTMDALAPRYGAQWRRFPFDATQALRDAA